MTSKEKTEPTPKRVARLHPGDSKSGGKQSRRQSFLEKLKGWLRGRKDKAFEPVDTIGAFGPPRRLR